MGSRATTGVPDVIVAAGYGGRPRPSLFEGTSILGGGGLHPG
jgi:hypothetical protein